MTNSLTTQNKADLGRILNAGTKEALAVLFDILARKRGETGQAPIDPAILAEYRRQQEAILAAELAAKKKKERNTILLIVGVVVVVVGTVATLLYLKKRKK